MATGNRTVKGTDGLDTDAVVIVDNNGNVQGTAANPQTASEPDGAVPPGSPYSATAAGVLFTIDTLGYDALSVILTNMGTGNVISFYESNDNIYFVNKFGDHGNNNSNSDNGTTVNGQGYSFPCTARYIRAVVTTYATGTVTAQAIIRSSSAPVRSVFLNGGTAGASVQKNTSGGLSQMPFRTNTAASPNGLIVKAGAGQVYGYTFANTSTGWRYVHFFNQSVALNPGVNQDVRVVPIPPGGVVMYSAADIGIAFSAGIVVSVTTAPANNDNTVSTIAVNDVTGMIDYA
jgi:hypothetical protein